MFLYICGPDTHNPEMNY